MLKLGMVTVVLATFTFTSCSKDEEELIKKHLE